MNGWTARQVTAALAVIGGVVALVGNALAPRFNGDDVDIYRKIAHSSRYATANVIILIALLLVTAAFVGISRHGLRDGSSELAQYGRVASVAGGAIALLQVGVETFGYRQQARAFDTANAHNVVSAFWATNALDHINAGMFAVWTIALLGLAPMLLGAAQLRNGTSGRLGFAAVLGGATCFVVGIGELLASDQSKYDVPFAIGSVIVTIWLIATGVLMWRRADVVPRQRVEQTNAVAG
jgi:hypothetical protein